MVARAYWYVARARGTHTCTLYAPTNSYKHLIPHHKSSGSRHDPLLFLSCYRIVSALRQLILSPPRTACRVDPHFPGRREFFISSKVLHCDAKCSIQIWPIATSLRYVLCRRRRLLALIPVHFIRDLGALANLRHKESERIVMQHAPCFVHDSSQTSSDYRWRWHRPQNDDHSSRGLGKTRRSRQEGSRFSVLADGARHPGIRRQSGRGLIQMWITVSGGDLVEYGGITLCKL